MESGCSTVVGSLFNIIWCYNIWQCKLEKKLLASRLLKRVCLQFLTAHLICLITYLKLQLLASLRYAGCGDTDLGAVRVDAGEACTEEESRRRREEFARKALEFAGHELLDYSEEEESEEAKEKEEETMDVDDQTGGRKEESKGSNEVFLSPEEEEKAKKVAEDEARMKAASLEDARKARERRRREEHESNERRKEEARIASELGRELGRKAAKAKVDNRYHAVRSIRSARQAGRELILKRHMVVPGTVVMLGSMTQLAKYGTAWYAGEWIKARMC